MIQQRLICQKEWRPGDSGTSSKHQNGKKSTIKTEFHIKQTHLAGTQAK